MRITIGLLALVLSPATLGCYDGSVDASRLAIAGGSITEIVFALQEQERIVAVDRTSNYPAAAVDLPSVGYVRNLSAEGVLSLNPTLVIGEDDMGPPEVLQQLTQAGVDIISVPEIHSADGIVSKVRCIGRLLQRESAAERLIATALQPIVERLPKRSDSDGQQPRGAVLLGLRDGAPLGAGRDTSGDGLLAMAGARNVLSAFSGWKPVSIEAMVLADPDFLVIPQRGIDEAGGIDEILKHPALRLTRVASERRIITMDGMTMLGFGPRTLTAAARLAAEIGDDTASRRATTPGETRR